MQPPRYDHAIHERKPVNRPTYLTLVATRES